MCQGRVCVVRLCQGLPGGQLHDGVQTRVDPRYLVKMGLNYLDRRDLAIPNAAGECGRRGKY